MEAKVFRVRSVGGTAAVLAVRLSSEDEQVQTIIEEQGFQGDGNVLVATLRPRPISATYSAHDWQTGEGVHADWPMLYVHKQITERWDELRSGDEIDVLDVPNPN